MLGREEKPEEGGEIVFHEFRDVQTRGQTHGAVIRGFHAAAAREGEDEHFLGPVGIRHAESDGEHELRRLEGDLNGAEIVEPEALLFLDVHLREEEEHTLADVGLKNRFDTAG